MTDGHEESLAVQRRSFVEGARLVAEGSEGCRWWGGGGGVKRGEALAIREQRVITVVARNKAEWNEGWNWGSQSHSSVSELGLTYNTTKPSADRTRDEHYESRSSCLSTPPGYWGDRETD